MDVHTESAKSETEVSHSVRRPHADLAVSASEWRLWVELPGVEPAAVEVRLEPAGLTVSARARRPVVSETRPLTVTGPDGKPTEAEPTADVLAEFAIAGLFQRQFHLGEQWDRTAMSVEVANGLLVVRLPVRPGSVPDSSASSATTTSAATASGASSPTPTKPPPIRIPVRAV